MNAHAPEVVDARLMIESTPMKGSDMMFCKNCGKEIPLDAFYCCYCGVAQMEDIKKQCRTIEVELQYNSISFDVNSFNHKIINSIFPLVLHVDPLIKRLDKGAKLWLHSDGIRPQQYRIECGELVEKYLLDNGFHRQPGVEPDGPGGSRKGVFEKRE